MAGMGQILRSGRPLVGISGRPSPHSHIRLLEDAMDGVGQLECAMCLKACGSFSKECVVLACSRAVEFRGVVCRGSSSELIGNWQQNRN